MLRTLNTIMQRLSLLAMLALVACAGFVAYRLMRAQVAGDVYLERLTQMQAEYEGLRLAYNEAVRRTAVTELVVADGKVSVAVRDASGAVRTIDTPFSPEHEIYVDYVVVEGRLWIRRVFDEKTPPDRAVVIDPALAHVDWDASNVAHGKAAYRRLGEGRWVVTVTGDGSLGLARAPEEPVRLVAAPSLRDYAPIEAEARAAADDLTPLDVLRHALGR